MNAEIISITFTSPKCFYCDNPWEYKVEVEPIDSKTKELTGNLVDMRVCQSCLNTKMTAFNDRIRKESVKNSEKNESN